MRVRGTALEEVIVDADTVEAIKQLAEADSDTSDPDKPLTLEDALDTIELRIRRRMRQSNRHPRMSPCRSAWNC